ncbi:MAG: integrase [Phycisphaeraceae bacterium]|nr:integrase [Phycisphaeraceae bacterium]
MEALIQPTRARRVPSLFDQIRGVVRARHYSHRVEDAHCHWIRRFILFHDRRHPARLGSEEVSAFLSHLAVHRRVSAATLGEVLAALLFLYRQVLEIPVPWLDGVVKATRTRRLPRVLTRDDVRTVLGGLRETPWLMVSLLYGSGLRPAECLRLRFGDVDLDGLELTVRDGAGREMRRTMISETAGRALPAHLREIARLHDRDVARGFGWADLPPDVDRRVSGAARDRAWQYVFPASRLGRDSCTGTPIRFHQHESVLHRAVRQVARAAGLRDVALRSFRHSFAAELIRDGHDVCALQELLGHRDVRTTIVYIYLLTRGGSGGRSPGDAI